MISPAMSRGLLSIVSTSRSSSRARSISVVSSAARCWCQACAHLAACEPLVQDRQVGVQPHQQRLGVRNGGQVAIKRGARLDHIDQDQARCPGSLVV
jgi:hypothetical protein